VVASILQNRSSFGLGNVIGSSISNILGAFSLGLLLFPEGVILFDRSSKIYAGASFLVTTVFVLLVYSGRLDFTGGIFFLVSFTVYLFSIGSAVFEGFLTAPVEEGEGFGGHGEEAEIEGLGISTFTATLQVAPDEDSPLISNITDDPEEATSNSTPQQYRLVYHVVMVFVGLLALSLSGYVLLHSASDLATLFHLSGTLIGITVLAFATTLPKKLRSTLLGVRGHSGMLVATTAGSNTFLLTLCLGILFISRGEGDDSKELGQMLLAFEVWTAWGCSFLLVVIVFVGGRRWMGPLLLAFYVAFIGAEFTSFRR
jgi:Ca2+/Na+ antiporter